jgi:hypothetical protein
MLAIQSLRLAPPILGLGLELRVEELIRELSERTDFSCGLGTRRRIAQNGLCRAIQLRLKPSVEMLGIFRPEPVLLIFGKLPLLPNPSDSSLSAEWRVRGFMRCMMTIIISAILSA